MATHTFADGSTLELEGEELILFLKATGQYVEPKSQAQIVAETMLQLRRAEEHGHEPIVFEPESAVSVIQGGDNPTMDAAMETVIAGAKIQAKDTGEIVEIGNFRVMPDQRVIPKHVEYPGGKPPAPKVRLPLSEMEMDVMKLIRRLGNKPVTSKQLAEGLGRSSTSVSANLSHIFQSQRGLVRGPRCTWSIANWAMGAEWFLHGYPNTKWKELNNA